MWVGGMDGSAGKGPATATEPDDSSRIHMVEGESWLQQVTPDLHTSVTQRHKIKD